MSDLNGAPPPRVGLREQRRLRIRQDIQDAALDLCAQFGFHAVRVEDIAQRAGVSSRTLFRYFPTKEDIFVEPGSQPVGALCAALSKRPAGTTPHDVLRHLCMLLADHYVARREFFAARHRLLLDTPVLARRAAAYRPQFVESLHERLVAEVGAHDDASRQLYILLGALHGALDSALRLWLDRGGAASLHCSWRAVFQTMAPAVSPLLGHLSPE